MKQWLIHTMAQFCGTDQYYTAFAEEDPTDWLWENFFDQECQNLWDSYSFYNSDRYEEEWEELDQDEKDEVYDNNFDNFLDNKYEEWCADCSFDVREKKEDEDLNDYAPSGTELEIIYDERNR